MKRAILLILAVVALLPTGVGAQQLVQKVSIASGGKRLSDVLGALTTSSAVRIRCGKNTSDWQIRDLPIDVYAKDVPLGTLLSWIAEVSHLAVISSDVLQDDGKSVSTYAVRRDRQGDAELAADEARSLAEAGWTWDVFRKLGQEPDSAADDATDNGAESRRLAAKIIASLPADAKSAVLSGEAVLLDARSGAQSQLIREMVKATAGGPMSAAQGIAKQNGPSGPFSTGPFAKGRMTVEIGPSVLETQTDTDARQAMIRVQMLDRGGESGASIIFVMSPMVFDLLIMSYDYELKASDDDASRLALPARPIVHNSDHAYDCGGSKRSFLTSDRDWSSPVLQTKVHLDLPRGNRTYADMLSALAKATGFTVVCEDYSTARTGSTPSLSGIAEDTTIGAALRSLDSCWFAIDEKQHLILGWAKDWRTRQRDLAPERLLSDAAAKMSGRGADLDDAVPLASLTMGQINEWLRPRNDKLADFAGILPNRMLWRLYAALTSDAKLAARLPEGVSLAEVDLDALREDFRRLRRYDEISVTTGTSATEAEKRQAAAEYRAISSMIADPTQLNRAGLRLKSVSRDDRTAYWLELEFPKDEGGFTIRVDGGPALFPIKSAKQ